MLAFRRYWYPNCGIQVGLLLRGASMKAFKWVVLGMVVMGLAVVPSAAWAGGVVVTNASSGGWVRIGTSNTFGLPADLSGISCGTENETTCEPAGVFDFNVSFAASSLGNFNILDEGGVGLSDQIQISNDPTTGLGVVTFLSDPNLGNAVSSGASDICNEVLGSGCIVPITITTTTGATIVITAASDSESVFDPFGLGADSSDELQIMSGATVGGTTPEPSRSGWVDWFRAAPFLRLRARQFSLWLVLETTGSFWPGSFFCLKSTKTFRLAVLLPVPHEENTEKPAI